MLLQKKSNTIQEDSRPGAGCPDRLSFPQILPLFYMLIGSPGSWCRLNMLYFYLGGTVVEFNFSECSSVFSGKFRNGTSKEIMAASFQMLDYSPFSLAAA
jgi:hypothetical protein